MPTQLPKKQVLIIDASPLLREFLIEKLTEENIAAETAEGHRDAFIKLSSLLPDLVIMNLDSSVADMQDFLDQKIANPNTVRIPVIIAGPHIEKEEATSLVRYGVVKYFAKPIKFDVFFESIGKILNSVFSLDTTPCVLEIHLNKNIIFIELAQGMNREKMALLKYKLSEMMDKNSLESPKVIVMMTDLSLSFVDGSNLEVLFDNILADRRIERKNVKVLSLDSFVIDFISGHPEYQGIEVAENLTQILNSLVESGAETNVQELVSNEILTPTNKSDDGSFEMTFYSDSGAADGKEDEEGSILNIAIVDEDPVSRQLLESTFKTINAQCDIYANGAEFLKAVNTKEYTLIVLDIFMNEINGLAVLQALRKHQIKTPVLVYSQATQRETIIRSLSLGAKTYLVKPQRTEVIINKALDIIDGKI